MIYSRIEKYKNGWFIGDFDPSLLKTKNFECGVKFMKQGDVNPAHYHSESVEINYVCYGKVMFNDILFESDSIILIEKNECSEFKCVENCCLFIVRDGSNVRDKYEC